MILALTWPIILGLDRVESASLLRLNGTFQFLTGLPSFPDQQTLLRFLLPARRAPSLLSWGVSTIDCCNFSRIFPNLVPE